MRSDFSLNNTTLFHRFPVGERRKKEAMVALAESMIGGDRSNSDTPAVPKQPLPLRESAANTRGARVKKEMEVGSRLVLADNSIPYGRFVWVLL